MRGTIAERTEDAELPDGLRAHWRSWLGATDDELAVLGAVHDGPPPVVVVGAEGRTRPGWDGAVHAVTGVVDGAGAAVVSVPPAHLGWARSYVAQARDDEGARGKGLARRLVAQASRTLHAQGIVATYLHDPANVASARVADAAGFPDRGWGVLGIFQAAP